MGAFRRANAPDYQAFAGVERFSLCPAACGQEHDPQGERAFPLEVNAMVVDGRLQVDFEYPENSTEPASIADEFLATLAQLIEHCASGEAGGFTASDFADFDWGDDQLGAITGAIRKAQGDAGEPEGESR